MPSLKVTATAPENGWLEDDPFLLGSHLFRGELLVPGRVYIYIYVYDIPSKLRNLIYEIYQRPAHVEKMVQRF